jgi:hypothetical protein
MTDERDTTTTEHAEMSEVPREDWPSWCTKATSDHNGREVILRQADRALGEVRLAKGQRLVAIEHDEFGRTEALTIKCGSTAVPVSYVVAEPQSIRQRRDHAGEMEEFSILDATGRRTSVSFG